jgi:hypothetical protein
MLSVDPKDQEIDGPDPVFNAAWNERRMLRLQRLDLKKQIEELDEFIATHERLSAQRTEPNRTAES